jgi:hypothetical protein
MLECANKLYKFKKEFMKEGIIFMQQWVKRYSSYLLGYSGEGN